MPTISRKELRAPDRFVSRSMMFFHWLEQNRQQLLIGLVVFAILAGAAALLERLSASRSEKATRDYDAVLAVVNAHVGADTPDPSGATPTEATAPSFATDEERQDAAVKAYRGFLRRHGGGKIAIVARLGLATELYSQHAYDAAKREYETALDQSGHEGESAAQAVEGIGYCLEAKSDPRGALRRFDELARIDNGLYRDRGQYHQARMYEQSGETARARELYRSLLERLRQRSGDARNAYLLPQTEARLAELDSSFVPESEGPSLPAGLSGPGGPAGAAGALRRFLKGGPGGKMIPFAPPGLPPPGTRR